MMRIVKGDETLKGAEKAELSQSNRRQCSC